MSSTPKSAPPPLDSWRSACEEVAPFRDATPREHYRAFAEACRLAFLILANHPERRALLDYVDPLPADSIALLERLRRRHAGDA